MVNYFTKMSGLKLNIKNKGFTLIELLIAMAISGIVLAGIVTFYTNQQKIHTAQNQAVEMQQTIRVALYIMTAEIRMAGFDQYNDFEDIGITEAGTGGIGIANRLEFEYVEPRDDEADPPVKKTVYYYLNDSKIQGSGGPIAENISNLQFIYLDIDGNSTAVIDDIRAVQIEIQVTTDANERSLNTDRTLTTIVKFRNLGL